MNLLKWCLDTTNNRLVISDASFTPFDLPPFFQGDAVPIELCLLQANPIGGFKTPYSKITDASYTVTIGLVSPSADPMTAVQYTFADLVFNGVDLWTGTLLLNVTEIDTLLGSARSATCYLEIVVTTGSGVQSTEFQQQTTVVATGLKTGMPAPQPGQTYVTTAQFKNEAARKVGLPGESFTLVSEDGLKGMNLRVTKDAVTGEYKFENDWIDL